jgi:hypothetical protein
MPKNNPNFMPYAGGGTTEYHEPRKGRRTQQERIAELEAALHQIAHKMDGAHDGGHIFAVQDILRRVLQKSRQE